MRRAAQICTKRGAAMPYATSEMTAVMDSIHRQLNDPSLVQSLHFSPTALTMVRRVMRNGGDIIVDAHNALAQIHKEPITKLKLHLHCFIDDPQIVSIAEKRHVTRAEVALDRALSLPKARLIVVGSAPMALARLLSLHQQEPLTNTVVLATPTGFASVVQLKERLWDSGIPCIVVRGKRGGTIAATAALNALLAQAANNI